MRRAAKTGQLQIRVTAAQKAALHRRARQAGMSMSEWVLSRALPPAQEAFQRALRAIASSSRRGYAVAELNELLTGLAAVEFGFAVAEPPGVRLEPYWENYVAAMIEHAAVKKNVASPAWTGEVPPLEEPVFGTSLESLRLHLLTNSPPAFRRRNIFIDSSIGDRV